MSPRNDYILPINNSVDGRIIMDPAAIAAFVADRNGPVMRDVVVRATRVQDAARKQVRLGHIGGGENAKSRGQRSRARGNLRYSIVKRVVETNGQPSVMVGSDNPIALLHHEGTKPHVIRPRNAKVLAFWGGEGNSQQMFARQVNHPGTKPNRYLTDNLHLAL